MLIIKVSTMQFLAFLLLSCLYRCHCLAIHNFIVKEAPYTRLCSTKNILTVNGQYPGPTLYAHRGDTVIVDVYNQGKHNITIHWHGVKQPRNPWSDGPAYITQCPIQPGRRFRQKVIFSGEEGSLWWHAHSKWFQATVHGAIIVYPKIGTTYPFPIPAEEVPIILGEWWKGDISKIFEEALGSGGVPKVSDAHTINGQPGVLFPCSKQETFRLQVKKGQTYLLRIINAALHDMLFLSVANHNITVVASDASYVRPFSSNYITISPGQTIDALLEANQHPNHYYMAAKTYTALKANPFDSTTTTAIIEYETNHYYIPPSSPNLPHLPNYNDTSASLSFMGRLRSLGDENHPIEVPIKISKRLFYTFSLNTFPCPNNSCTGTNGTILAASVNNISFVEPTVAILQAYYYYQHNNKKFYGTDFPDVPPTVFNYTAPYLSLDLQRTKRGTVVKVLEYNSTVEIILQGNNLVASMDHPIHLHGFSFYVVGWGLGNFDKENDPLRFNLVDPPLQNTIVVPASGWAAIRFTANNPGVWFMHCHFEPHMLWGMDVVFIVKNGKRREEEILPQPSDMPPC